MINIKSTPVKIAALASPLVLAGGIFLAVSENGPEDNLSAPSVQTEGPGSENSSSEDLDPADLSGLPSTKPGDVADPQEASGTVADETPDPTAGEGVEVSKPAAPEKVTRPDDGTVVLTPDGEVAPEPGSTRPDPANPGTSEPGSPDDGTSTSPTPPPSSEPPVTVPEFPVEIKYNNITLADACVGVPVLSVEDAVKAAFKKDYAFTSENAMNGHCRYLGAPSALTPSPSPSSSSALVLGEEDTENNPEQIEVTANYLPAKAKYLGTYTASSPSLSGIGEKAHVVKFSQSTLVVAYQGDYAILMNVTSGVMSEAERIKVARSVGQDSLDWINELAPTAESYFESHPGQSPDLVGQPAVETPEITDPGEKPVDGINEETVKAGEGNFFSRAAKSVGSFFTNLFS